jgi:hypothetical protein
VGIQAKLADEIGRLAANEDGRHGRPPVLTVRLGKLAFDV